MKGDNDGGLAYEKKSMAPADPSCVDCLSNAAEMLKRKGLHREAWEAASLAFALLPEEQRRASVLARQVARYRRDLAPDHAP